MQRVTLSVCGALSLAVDAARFARVDPHDPRAESWRAMPRKSKALSPTRNVCPHGIARARRNVDGLSSLALLFNFIRT